MRCARKRFAALGVLMLLILCGWTSRAKAIATKIRVAVNVTNPPYQFLDENGQCAGMHIDILNYIAAENDYLIEYLPMQSNEDCKKALQNQTADIILGVGSTSSQANDMLVSSAISSSTLCMIVDSGDVRQSGADYRRIAIQLETIPSSMMNIFSGCEFLTVGNQQQVLQAQRSGRVSAMIGVRESLLYQISELGLEDDYTILYNYLGSIEYYIGMPGSNHALKRNIDLAVSKLYASGEYEKIQKRWLPSDDPNEQILFWLKLLLIGAAIILPLIAGYLIFVSRMRIVLQRKVDQQTKDIQSANEALRENLLQIQHESELRNRIIRYSPSGMILFDRSYAVRLMNESALRMEGLAKDAAVEDARNLRIFGKILREIPEDIFKKGALIVNRSMVMTGEDGKERYYRYTLHQILQDNAISGDLLTVQDITEEEREKQMLFEKNKSSTLNQIIAGIAHEIRNPLTSIKAFASLIVSNGGDEEVRQSFAEFVPKEIDRINQLIEGLIQYAKPFTPHFEAVEIDGLIQECLYLLKPSANAGTVALTLDLTPGLFVWADRNQLKQVFINIIMNGADSIREKLQKEHLPGPLGLRITSRADADSVEICVRDEGLGMTQEEMRRCMQPFYTKKARGTGLGLSLCEQYVRDNGGQISVKSEKDQFAEFSLRFRRNQHEATGIDN